MASRTPRLATRASLTPAPRAKRIGGTEVSPLLENDARTGLAPAFEAARARLGLIAALFGLAAVAWWSTAAA
jgi:hypothetical protein